MKYLNREIETLLKKRGAELIRCVSISHLDQRQSRRFSHAIVFTFPLTAKYIREVADTPNYVQARIDDNFNFDDDEYLQVELKTGKIADELARLLNAKGYKSISQSDEELITEGAFDFDTKTSVLPHKTIALLSGIGWIGKNNQLITPEYGSAQCLGTVLTDAPLKTIIHEPLLPKCGNCVACIDICEKHVLKRGVWSIGVSRDEIIDVFGCSTCLKCLVHCSVTQAYVKRHLLK